MQAAPSVQNGRKKVFVTGATGFIGVNLCRRLLLGNQNSIRGSEYEVHILVRRVPLDGELAALAAALPDGALVVHQGDVTDLSAIEKALKQQHESPTTSTSSCWTCVYHVAGLIAYSSKMRAQMEAVNIEGTRNVCLAMRTFAPDARLVYVSSVTAVGANRSSSDVPLDENAPWNQALGDSVGYMYTKRAAEQVVMREFSEIDSIILCPSNVYGAGDASKKSRSTQLKAARGEWPLYTNGGVSLVDIDAMVDVLIKSTDRNVGRKGERYIISGDNIKIFDMLRMYSEFGTKSAKKAPWLLFPNWALWLLCFLAEKFASSSSFTLERATVATLYHWFDNTKAKNELGLQVKPAHECIQESVEWMRQTGLLE